MQLITTKQAKLDKSRDYGFMTAGLTLSPANESGYINTCSHSTAGCRVGCLKTSGRYVYDKSEKARIRRTEEFVFYRKRFLDQLNNELGNLENRAKKAELYPAFRLNVLSDLPWEAIAPKLFYDHIDIQFYDYTKNPRRMQKFLNKELPPNYHLAFSLSENYNNEAHAYSFITQGVQVAVVYFDKLPRTQNGYRGTITTCG